MIQDIPQSCLVSSQVANLWGGVGEELTSEIFC